MSICNSASNIYSRKPHVSADCLRCCHLHRFTIALPFLPRKAGQNSQMLTSQIQGRKAQPTKNTAGRAEENSASGHCVSLQLCSSSEAVRAHSACSGAVPQLAACADHPQSAQEAHLMLVADAPNALGVRQAHLQTAAGADPPFPKPDSAASMPAPACQSLLSKELFGWPVTY